MQLRKFLYSFCLGRYARQREQRRAALTSLTLLGLLAVMITGILIRYWFRENFYPLDFVVLGATWLAYLGSRTPYYRFSALFVIIIMCAAAYLGSQAYLRAGGSDVLSRLVWLTLPLFLASLLFSGRMMLLAVLLPALTLLLFIWQEQVMSAGPLVAVLLGGGALAVLAAYAYDQDLSTIQQQHQEIQRQHQRLLAAYEETLLGWAKLLELYDKETRGHSERVTRLTLEVARALGIQDEETLRLMRYGALLHDMGKVAVPSTILRKPEPLTPEERREIERHTEYAYEVLKDIAFLHPALDIPRYHHERWDGSGYPYGLKGEQIPLAARIFAVVDVWDALTHPRPYRPAWSKEQARAYLSERAGKDFDPAIVHTFLLATQNAQEDCALSRTDTSHLIASMDEKSGTSGNLVVVK